MNKVIESIRKYQKIEIYLKAVKVEQSWVNRCPGDKVYKKQLNSAIKEAIKVTGLTKNEVTEAARLI